ncbi:uncharacterized protein LOC125951670 [Anopheles darlingi]|uniref:uncharacterized protein LOC125951670 n=1 Tax=Anopheles darlingi TaxID=43151 RepID=UPI0021000F0E|nr:uncharacterized protein LOC125951670 [Anopheles darlingi]
MVVVAVAGHEMWIPLLLLPWLWLSFVPGPHVAHAIKLTGLRVPKYAILGQSVRLECPYEMEGDELYSVRWYKDGNEFYRFVPRDKPEMQVFPQRGVSVNVHNSSNNHVTLETVKLSTSGKYLCEVSAEAPDFQTVSQHGEMVVVVLPDEDPIITGGKARYQINDYVRVNCTSGRARPAAQLAWYINSELVDPALLRRYPTIVSFPDQLETSILGLEFRVKQKHFRRGDMKLKCLATIHNVYWKSNEESVENDKPQKAPILESRKSGLSSSSSSSSSSVTRADRVHAGNGATGVHQDLDRILLLLCALFSLVLVTSRHR